MPDSKYAHLEADDVRKMTEAVQEGWKFFTEAQIKLKDLQKHEVVIIDRKRKFSD